ncbi:hypothetical protein [Diaphorobacter sp.]|uniref:hypothetical protein n=1 Tax=Diaphorobacter sp. TaxID=1934310 RepID=UPI00258F340E|nr:hypothetical protein [Diaphorobacter sp.]
MALFTCQPDLTHATPLVARTFENEQVLEAQLRNLLEFHLPRLLPQRRLMVLAAEYTNWSNASRFIDLLALDAEGQLVVVEIKRTGDGGHAELQALRYAAMLSTHTIENVIDARHRHLLKTDATSDRDDVESEILEFLGKGDTDEVTLGTTPQVILIARDFSPEITTTAMWLNERMDGFLMHCFTVQLYPLPSGQYALHFDLLLPLPQQEDYLVKVRDKNAEIARQAAATQRRQRTCSLLEEKGKLKAHDSLYLVRRIHKDLPTLGPDEQKATYLGDGQVRWQNQTYSSLSDLTLTLRNRITPHITAIPGTEYWGLEPDGPSLARLASELAQ